METEEDLIIVYLRKNAKGDKILVSIFIDKSEERISGFIVTDINGVPQASADIQKCDENGIPIKILYVWHSENQALLLEFRKTELNKDISVQKWEMPNKRPKLNMADD